MKQIQNSEDANRVLAQNTLRSNANGYSRYLGRKLQSNLDPLKQFIFLSGLTIHQRYLALYYSNSCYLTATSFRYLFLLSHARFLDYLFPMSATSAGYLVNVHTFEPSAPHNTARYIFRLKSELETSAPDLASVIRNNRDGNYWLDVPGDHLAFDWQRLAKSPLADVQDRSMAILQLFPGQPPAL